MSTYQNLFPDQRLADRADLIAQAMAEHQSVTIRSITKGRAEAAGAYRFFSNSNVSLSALKAGLLRHCRSLVERSLAHGEHYGEHHGEHHGHILVLQDTTQLNYEHMAGRLGADHHLGVIGDNESLGCFLHPSLAIDAETHYCLGLSDVQLWTRPKERPDKHQRGYKQQPLEEKESFRWLKSIAASRAVLERAEQVTMVADRESDIFEVAARVPDAVPDAKTDLLVRAGTNRRVRETPGMLYEHVAEQAVAGRYAISVRGDMRQNRPGREAQIEVRHARVHLRRPGRLSRSDHGSDYPEEVELYVVEAKEQAATVEEGVDPILWRLLTSHPVEDFEAARQVIKWYQQRWQIEQYFRLLKTGGLDLEDATLEDGHAFKRLCLMALGAALQVMRLLLVREGKSNRPVGHVFAHGEQRCLEELMPEWEGSTRKQQNPHKAGTLAWASWLIARLGGWKGYWSQGPPGPITYFRGMHRFAQIYQGWRLARA